MKHLNFEQYQKFLKGEIKVKVIDKESLFYGCVCPVWGLAIDFVSCDVEEDGGTSTFYYNQVELTDEPIKIIEF